MTRARPRVDAALRNAAGIAALLVAISTMVPAVALADQRIDLGAPPEGVAPTDNASWDVPGVVVIDEKDDISDSTEKSLFAKLSHDFSDVRFADTDLVKQTHIHLALVAPSEVPGLIADAESQPGVVEAEPLAWVEAMFTPNVRSSSSNGT
jgi:hypothetical protein